LLEIQRVKRPMPSEVPAISGDQSVEALRRELAEAREQQAATAEILAAISNSPTDAYGVFAEIAASAARLCDAYDAGVLQHAGDHLLVVAQQGPIPVLGSIGQATLPLKRGVLIGRAVLDRQTVHVADLQAETVEYPEGSEFARRLGHRTMLAVPLIRAGEAIGAIYIRRTEVRPFTDRQIDLLKTFADQAVIAIENTRLFEEVQASKRELQESLEYQTATSAVLEVISRSPTDAKPVFDSIALSAASLCGAQFCHVFRFDGDLIHYAASNASSLEQISRIRDRYPIAPGRASATARCILTASVVEIPDVHLDPEYEHRQAANAVGFRSIVAVPMIKGARAIGAIVLLRSDPGRFQERQIELLKTFADQAVIAIENTRLFEEVQVRSRELSEALEEQTATSQVLSIISTSPGQLEPVFHAMLKHAVRICEAKFGVLFGHRAGKFHAVAWLGVPPAYEEPLRQRGSFRPEEGAPLDRLLQTKSLVHSADELAENSPSPAAKYGGARSLIATPMFKEDEIVGAIVIYRTEVRPFTDKQVGLVSNFAKQAVIAIENTRLLNELRESLQQQTATADVLKVISRAAFDLPRVLDTLVESAASLCDSYDTAIWQKDGDVLRIVSRSGHIPSIGRGGTVRLTRGGVVGRAVLDRQTIHIADVQSETDEYPESSAIARRLSYHTVLTVPLVGAGEAVGAIALRRSEVRPFTDRQIELLQTFADQAVIAIENTRLFEEVQARTRELAKTVEDLEIASQHKSQFVANMSHELRTPLAAILGYAELMQEGFYEPLGQKSLDALTRIRSNGKHLLGLINTVLDIAKIESGQFTLNMVEYAIESVVETVRSATESLAQNKKLALKTEVAKSLPIGLGDEQRLTQVLLNLVGNAIKFTDTGEVRVTATAVNGHFNVTVTDTGPGIPEEHQARIFEQFHQVDSSNTKAKGGTGLGLAIAKQIVEMHGGRIWVDSTLGKGSTFQMELPTRAEFRKTAL